MSKKWRPLTSKQFDYIKRLQGKGYSQIEVVEITKRAKSTIHRIFESETLEGYKRQTLRMKRSYAERADKLADIQIQEDIYSQLQKIHARLEAIENKPTGIQKLVRFLGVKT